MKLTYSWFYVLIGRYRQLIEVRKHLRKCLAGDWPESLTNEHGLQFRLTVADSRCARREIMARCLA